MSYFDELETRSTEARAQALAEALPAQIARAQGLGGYAGALDGVDAAAFTSREALAALPVLRKSDPGQGAGGGCAIWRLHHAARAWLLACVPVPRPDL